MKNKKVVRLILPLISAMKFRLRKVAGVKIAIEVIFLVKIIINSIKNHHHKFKNVKIVNLKALIPN
jgi:hypothetical protein